MEQVTTPCSWAGRSAEEQVYHDTEWGVPCHDDTVLFEFLVLETLQAGLSWTLIMKRREGLRELLDGFAIDKVAAYGEAKEQVLLTDSRMIRNRLKVKALARNAKAFIAIQEEFGSFDAYIWGFTNGEQVVGHWQHETDIPATSALSDRISKDLKKRNFTFVGSTIIYSFLQAIGIINDHVVTCPRYKELVEQK